MDAMRVRKILEFAVEPVEWWPISRKDNLQLAQVLEEATCSESFFGYWWKWFPERVRLSAPELVLDGDMILTRKPDWFDAFAAGQHVLRVSQDDLAVGSIYGKEYSGHVNVTLKLYSGAIARPPNFAYIDLFQTQGMRWDWTPPWIWRPCFSQTDTPFQTLPSSPFQDMDTMNTDLG